MQDPTTEILDPDQPLVLGSGQEIIVRELNWKGAKAFLGKLAARASEFLTIAPGGQSQVNESKLMGIIVTDLGEALILATTDLTAGDLEALPLKEMLLVLDRAVALNLRPELIEAGKAVAGRFGGLLGKKDQPSAKSTAG